MRYSNALLKTNKEAREFDTVNATLLQKGGFVHQVMAGVYTYLPLGLRVLNKIEGIVREEMDTLGSELLMTSLSPESLLHKTGRDESIDVLFEARGANETSRKRQDGRYILNATHEELATDVAMSFNRSYRDFPFAFYQIQTKFRNEVRPKSGLMRGREFRMKDMYSFHVSAEDFEEFYEKIKEAYAAVFERLGLGEDTHLVIESGGFMSKHRSHQFSTQCDAGEDIIYHDKKEDAYYTEEVASAELKKSGDSFQASEVGNIFPLQRTYSDPFEYTFTAKDGSQRPVIMGSYGLGTSRVMGVLVEKFHDERGIIWPLAVAPFTVYLLGLNLDDAEVSKQSAATYEKLTEGGVEVLYDDRLDTSPGAKFADADLLGIPWRVVVSRKTGGQVEVKRRDSDEVTLMSLDTLITTLTS